MNFNFKKNNILIILLLIFVILSCIVYINMINVKETYTNLNMKYENYFTYLNSDSSYNYYKLNDAGNKYKLKNLASINGLQKNTSISGEVYLQNNQLYNYYKVNNSLIGYFNSETDVSLINISSVNIVSMDLSTILQSDPSNIHTINMLFMENSGNLYDLSNNILSGLNIFINNINVINNGKFILNTTDSNSKSMETSKTEAVATSQANGGNVSIGDFNFSGLFGGKNSGKLDNELYSYLLTKGAFGSQYVPPLYNNFETAMNLPSNPIVNPVNSMNPLDYSQSLFGPNVTPMMVKNSYLNQNNANVTNSDKKNQNLVNSSDNESVNNLTNSLANNLNNNLSGNNSKNLNFDENGNLLAQNSGDNNNTTCTNVNVDSSLLKEKCPPCPAPQRCPESNFECKKVPNYEQGIDNAFLPRPVLTDFSTFGM